MPICEARTRKTVPATIYYSPFFGAVEFDTLTLRSLTAASGLALTKVKRLLAKLTKARARCLQPLRRHHSPRLAPPALRPLVSSFWVSF